MRRSWSGLNRAAFSTRCASTTWRCSSLTVSGSWPVARTITAACSGRDEPGVQGLGGGVVTGVQLRWPARPGGRRPTGHGGGLGEPGVGAGEPGVLRDPGLSQQPRPPSASRPRCRRIARSSSATTAACSPATSGGRRRRASGPSPRAPRPRQRAPGGCRRGGGRGVLTWAYSFSNICSSQELDSKCGQRSETASWQQPQRSSEATESRETAQGTARRPPANSNHLIQNLFVVSRRSLALAPQPPGVAALDSRVRHLGLV